MPSHPSPDARAAMTRLLPWARATIMTMAGTLICWYLPLPFNLIGLLFAAAGLVCGIVTCVIALRTPASGMLRIAAPIATLGCVLVALPLVVQLVFYGPTVAFKDCTTDALTLRSQALCTQHYQEQLMPAGMSTGEIKP
ncbi:hypothetical protein [Paeniglutamicibacter terrestris]|uniref:Uncharacterized protein n=1 Tax=Paeniglutamicibacter terrestris TaxID=2723403 RepID=A0ABX1G5R5_9MICC|nr:hypothetical protein [Paeniglutamicibacter terrestris]ASN40333.1 hypothetical protein CGQ24_15860 [Arthrobacter sp. 7749]NKG21324.1 hypothetical protein [Paeniglutamicibacter terrestris]